METFTQSPEERPLDILEREHNVTVSREDAERGKSYTLHRLLSPKECRRFIAVAEESGFLPAGLAMGDDTYRVNLKARNNQRVIFDSQSLALALWQRMKTLVDPRYEKAAAVGLNWRFRVYKYEAGQYFAPHYDVRTPLPNGETRFSVVIYLNEGFSGGATRFFETKETNSSRGRKRNNKEKYSLKPKTGAAVIFDHLLLHEGETVTEGVKYAVRSDLIYEG